MIKKFTELAFILDRSGSMDGLQSDTINGFNAMIEKLQKEEGEVIITTVLFDEQYKLLHDRLCLGTVRPMTQREYYVRGCTALLDAIGRTIVKISNVQKYLRKNGAEHVIFVITTEGSENASCEFTYNRLKKMIVYYKEKYDWEFIFLGSNMDAVKEASKLGINEDRAASFRCDSEGIALIYETIGDTVSSMIKGNPVGVEWKVRIEENYKKKKKMKNKKRKKNREFVKMVRV